MSCFIHEATLLNLVNETSLVTDLIVEEGMVTAMGQGLTCPENAQVIEARGLFLTTGWIDSHCHLNAGVNPDDMLKEGVTYVQEAGSTGRLNFADYYSRIVKPAKLRIASYLYLGPWGIEPEHELQDLTVIDPDAWLETYEQYRDVIRGIKMRIDPRVCFEPLKAMDIACGIARKTGLPIIVHASRCKEPLEEILGRMGKNDIFAHIYANKLPGLLDENGIVKKCAWEARERGVRFDLAHGNGNFSYEVARKAIAQGFVCDSVSTDIHERSLKNVKSVAVTMGKAMACGMDFWSVLRKVTSEPAAMLGLTDKQLTVEAGKPADLVLFRLEERPEELSDSDGVTTVVERHFVPVVTMLGSGIYRKE